MLMVPEFSLVVLLGSAEDRSRFARSHFLPAEVLSPDGGPGLAVVAERLEDGRLTVIDAPLDHQAARAPWVSLAKRSHCRPVAIVLRAPGSAMPSARSLEREGFRLVHDVDTAEVTVERQPLAQNRRHESGPFDLIGDVHGCLDELVALLRRLGYAIDRDGEGDTARYRVRAPEGRRVVLLGDLVDRGPKIVEALRLAMDMVDAGVALCVPGNHEARLLRRLQGKGAAKTHGLAATLAQLDGESDAFRARLAVFIEGMVSHYVFDDGRLVAAHAGMKESLQGRGTGRVTEFALYGETTGETDAAGLPVRRDWSAAYRGRALVVYGHTPVGAPEWQNNTVCIDTGCVYGGSLTALRYPERETVSVAAARVYCEVVG